MMKKTIDELEIIVALLKSDNVSLKEKNQALRQVNRRLRKAIKKELKPLVEVITVAVNSLASIATQIEPVLKEYIDKEDSNVNTIKD